MSSTLRRITPFVAVALGALAGCFRITVNPECPSQIETGQTGSLVAHETTPGGIPTYLWEAAPAELVEIVDPEEPDSTFEAVGQGRVIFTLTASDGLFQMIDVCTTVITSNEPPPQPELDLAVTLVAAPTSVEQGGSTLLTCTSTGTTPVAAFAIDQLDGARAELTVVSPGISVGVFNATGVVTIRCLGTDAAENRSDPALVTVTVLRPVRPFPR